MATPTAAVPLTTGVVLLNPVMLLNDVPVATPILGVTSVGLVANTSAPEPVSSVTAPAKFALEGVARNVATPVPSPLTPVLIGSPVQLVNVPDVGVPRAGVVNVGLVASTTAPAPVTPLLSADAEICEPLMNTPPTLIVPTVPLITSLVIVASGTNVK